MTASSRARAAELGAILARQVPEGSNVAYHAIGEFVVKLQDLAERTKAHLEQWCSDADYYRAHADADGEDPIEPQLQKEAYGLALEYQISLYGASIGIGGDPRGPCCWLKIKDVPGDGWDRDAGFAVY